MRRARFVAFAFPVAGLLAACAPPLKDPWGLAVLRSQAAGPDPVAPPAVPESLQADLGVSPHARGAFPFSARLYAEPVDRTGSPPAPSSSSLADTAPSSVPSAPRYRLDAFGFASTLAATWLWTRDAWVLVRHDERTVQRETGAALAIPGVPFHLPDVHAVLGFLWGRPLPGFPGGAALADTSRRDGIVRWTHEGSPWEARFDPATGLCLEVRSPRFAVVYRKHRAHGELVVPGEAEVFVGGEPLVTLVVRDWVAAPPWRRDPFEVTVPAGYHVLP